MAEPREQALARTRDGYAHEQLWHRFLVDAYTGGGGFAGRIHSPDLELGSISAAYPPCVGSYLDKYPREDPDKFRRRVEVAHYVNYIEPLTDLKCGLALSKPFVIENLPDAIAEWKDDVDGQRTPFEAMRERLVRRAALVGWAPTLLDMPRAQGGVRSAAQARDAGISPRLIPLFPANVTEWSVADGRLRWVKIRNDYCDRDTFDGPESKYALVDVWTEGEVARFRIADNKIAGEERIARSGRIPLTILRHKPAEDDPIVGLPMNGQVAIESRRLFNLCSALDEALDASCFPLLVMVDTLDPNTNAPDGGSEITLGASNALTLPAGSTQKHYYLAPPAEVFAAFERRIEETVKEMYRQGRVEFVRPAGSQNESGIARKHAFQQTNTAIESFAKCIAEWERDTYVTVGRLLGIEEAKLAEIRVIAPDDFDVDDIDAALKQCEAAFALKLGPTFNATMKKRIAGELLPDVSDETKAIIDEEIDAAETDASSSDAMNKPLDPFADVTDPNVQVPPAA